MKWWLPKIWLDEEECEDALDWAEFIIDDLFFEFTKSLFSKFDKIPFWKLNYFISGKLFSTSSKIQPPAVKAERMATKGTKVDQFDEENFLIVVDWI